MELDEARPLVQKRLRCGRIQDGPLAERGRGLLVSLERLEGGPLPDVDLGLPRFQGEGPIEGRDGLLVSGQALEAKSQEVPAFRILRRIPRRPLQCVCGLRKRIHPVQASGLVEPEVRRGRIRLDGNVEGLHGVLVAAEGQQQSGLPRGRPRVVRIELEDRVVSGQGLVSLAEGLVGRPFRGPGRSIRGVLLQNRVAGAEEDLRALRMRQGVPLASERIEVIGRDDPKPIEGRVRLFRFPECEERSSSVLQSARVMGLNRQDRIARRDEFRPTFRPEEELPLCFEAII